MLVAVTRNVLFLLTFSRFGTLYFHALSDISMNVSTPFLPVSEPQHIPSMAPKPMPVNQFLRLNSALLPWFEGFLVQSDQISSFVLQGHGDSKKISRAWSTLAIYRRVLPISHDLTAGTFTETLSIPFPPAEISDPSSAAFSESKMSLEDHDASTQPPDPPNTAVDREKILVQLKRCHAPVKVMNAHRYVCF